MEKSLFTGVCTALVTPFKDHNINYAMLEKLLQRQIDAGIKAVVISGTTGEAPTLSDYEKINMIRACKALVGEHLAIIAGTGTNNTEHSVTLSRLAEESGADGILAVSPYYNKATEAGLYAHYSAIAHSVQVPIIIYNVPSRTALDIPIDIYKKLSQIDNIIGVKEASTNISKTAKIRAQCGNSFYVWSGNDDMSVPVISMGGKGVISVLSNVLPGFTKKMVDSALLGDFSKALSLQLQVQEFCDLLFSEVNPIPVKAAMQLIGYDCGNCRLPLTYISKKNYNKIRNALLKLRNKGLIDQDIIINE